MQKKEVNGLWRLYCNGRAAGDGKLFEEQLVKNYGFIVNSIVKNIYPRQPPNIEIDDLRSEGTLALLESLRSYKLKKKAKFTTYAWSRVKGKILDYIRKESPNSRFTTARYYQLEQAKSRLENKLGYKPTKEQLIKELSKPEYEADPKNSKNPMVKAERREKAKLIIKDARNMRTQIFFPDINCIKFLSLTCILEEAERGIMHHYAITKKNKKLQGKQSLNPFYIIQKKDFWEFLFKGLTRGEKLVLKLHHFIFYEGVQDKRHSLRNQESKKLAMSIHAASKVLGTTKTGARHIYLTGLEKIRDRLEEKGFNLETCLRELV